MKPVVKDFTSQVVERIVERARQVISKQRVSKRIKEHFDVGTVHVPVLPIMEEEIVEVQSWMCPCFVVRRNREGRAVHVAGVRGSRVLHSAGSRAELHGGVDCGRAGFQFHEKTGEATMVIRQECVSERSVEQNVDVPTAFFSSVTSVTRRTS